MHFARPVLRYSNRSAGREINVRYGSHSACMAEQVGWIVNVIHQHLRCTSHPDFHGCHVRLWNIPEFVKFRNDQHAFGSTRELLPGTVRQVLFPTLALAALDSNHIDRIKRSRASGSVPFVVYIYNTLERHDSSQAKGASLPRRSVHLQMCQR
jgi:hypothetical protein